MAYRTKKGKLANSPMDPGYLKLKDNAVGQVGEGSTKLDERGQEWFVFVWTESWAQRSSIASVAFKDWSIVECRGCISRWNVESVDYPHLHLKTPRTVRHQWQHCLPFNFNISFPNASNVAGLSKVTGLYARSWECNLSINQKSRFEVQRCIWNAKHHIPFVTGEWLLFIDLLSKYIQPFGQMSPVAAILQSKQTGPAPSKRLYRTRT